jgi:deoxyribonuclease V
VTYSSDYRTLVFRPVAILDVHYGENTAIAAGIVARSWSEREPIEERVARVPNTRPYRAGKFFERELPCLVAVLSTLRSPFSAIVIDGYVVLSADNLPGLGDHLYRHLANSIPVIGVAKSPYGDGAFAVPVLRGTSQRPLFVTAAGIEMSAAARLIQDMHGAHRLPTLISRVDRLARRTPPPA